MVDSPYLKASAFAKLQGRDALGRVSIMALFNYVMRKVWLQQTRIGLSLYDVAGQGLLREADLENYILELLPTLPQLDGLEKSFHSFYVCTAVRKFFFFLDPLRTGRIRIQDVLACSFLDDLLEVLIFNHVPRPLVLVKNFAAARRGAAQRAAGRQLVLGAVRAPCLRTVPQPRPRPQRNAQPRRTRRVSNFLSHLNIINHKVSITSR
jgi:hypothetical protein